jgi:tRNA(Arg) A34 adenosine deaminase TadA
MMESEAKYMREAIKVAKQNIVKGEFPFGCCIVTDDNIVVSACNTSFSKNDPTAHAEINAIRDLCNTFGKVTLEKTIIFTTTEPCLMCMGAINWAKIPRLVYGVSIYKSFEFGFTEIKLNSKEIAAYMPYRLEIVAGFLEEECLELYTLWENKRKVLNWFKNKRHANG